MNGLLVYALKRLALLPVMMFLLVTCAFFLTELIPGDPAYLILGEFASDQDVQELRAELGLDQPLWQRYIDYTAGVFRGDLGSSLMTGASVSGELLRRLPASFVIIIPALLLAVGMGTMMGSIAGYFRRRPLGRLANVGVSVTQGIPPFFLGIVLIFLLVFTVRVLPPPVGMVDSAISYPPSVTGILVIDALITWSPAVLASIAGHAVLPVLSVGIFVSAYFGKTVRSAMTQALATPQIEFARACGLPERQVVRYALLSARTGVLTYTAIMFGVLLSSTAIIELVFAWPGSGEWALDGVLNGDLPVIQGFVVVTGLLVIIGYLVVDVLIALLDPRINY